MSRSGHEKELIAADLRNRFANDDNGRPSVHREIIPSKIWSKVPITCGSIKRELKWHKEAVGFYRRYVTKKSTDDLEEGWRNVVRSGRE